MFILTFSFFFIFTHAKTVVYIAARDGSGTSRILLTKKTWRSFHPFYDGGNLNSVIHLIEEQTGYQYNAKNLEKPQVKISNKGATILLFYAPFTDAQKLMESAQRQNTQRHRRCFVWATAHNLQNKKVPFEGSEIKIYGDTPNEILNELL